MKDTERILLQTFDTLKEFYGHSGESFSCSLCKKDFGNMINLKKHTEKIHQFKCPYCPLILKSSEELGTHKNIHQPSTGRVILPCDTCGRVFYEKKST